MQGFYFDTVVFDPRALGYLINLVGADKVFVGTDAPFDIGDETPLQTLADAPSLTDAQRDQVTRLTPLTLLGENEVV